MLVELHHCVRAWWTLHMMHSVPSCSFLMTCTLKTFKLCLLKQSRVFCTKDRRGERVALFEGVHEVLRAMNWEIYCVLFVSFRYSFIQLLQLTAEMGNRWEQWWEVDVQCSAPRWPRCRRRWKSWWFLEAVWRWDTLSDRIKTSVGLTT